MDGHKKKKPRQRNRPKNKANRLHETQLNATENNEEIEIKSVNCEPRLKNHAHISCANSLGETAPPQHQLAALLENNASIKLIQQIIRTKLLKQNLGNNLKVADIKTESAEQNSAAKLQDSSAMEYILEVPATENDKKPVKKFLTSESVKKSKSREKLTTDNNLEKDAFINNLQKKMESVMTNGNSELPSTLLENLQKLMSQEPISDVESSDEEEEYIEYIYKPRQYFLVSLCNFCKCDLRSKEILQCSRCKMTYYCSAEHMKSDEQHRQLCYALRQVADSSGNHIFYKCGVFTAEQFRSYRIVTIRKVEAAMNRPLNATEQEVILFPRICANFKCREYRFSKLVDCVDCGEVSFCKNNPEHLSKQHKFWCKPYQLFKKLVIFQETFGRLDPSLPTKVLKDIPGACCSTRQILSKLAFDMHDQCEYAALSQISTCPLTAWYALKLCDLLKKSELLTIHLIGAEIDFEVDVLNKWELFFLHLTPLLKQLNVVFVGPELNPRNISFEQLKKTKCCRTCRKNERTVKYYFENKLYHSYCNTDTFMEPDLVCFFNAGLYRSTGFHFEDTWPDTILAVGNLKCPVVVTAYTAYEAPLDMSRFVQESNRRLNVVIPPIINPFASEKPERNFISDEDAPLMFKNYYCFVVE